MKYNKTSDAARTNSCSQSTQELSQSKSLMPALESMGQVLPLQKLLSTKKRNLFQAYADCQDTISKMYDESANLLTATLQCNTQWKTVRKKANVNEDTIRQALMNNRQEDQALSFSFGNCARAEIAVMDPEQISRVLVHSVRDQCVSLIDGLSSQLQYMVEIEQVGLVDWMSEDVCRLSFFQNEISDRRTGESSNSRFSYERGRRERVTKRQTSYERTLEHTKFVHDLIEAKEHRLPASHVAMPKRVKLLIGQIPPWLSPHCSVVTGLQIAENRKVQTGVIDSWSETKTSTRWAPDLRVSVDPAVVVGGYVLTGWN